VDSGGGTYIGTGKDRIFFPGCPVSHISHEIGGWLSGYRWLKMGKTPMELGLITTDELDPRWFDAMEMIDAEVARIREEQMSKPTPTHG
jgi:hypothetical protein